MKAVFTFLGTGSSMGVPVIGCSCRVCKSKNQHNHRLRPAGFLQIKGKNILVDVGPDFRQQAIKHDINRLDGIILTHLHFDHIAGIDELRIFNFRQKAQIPCLLSEESLKALNARYAYLFESMGRNHSLSVKMDFHVIEKDFGDVNFLGFNFTCVSYYQGGMKVTGFRINDFAYISDIKEYDPQIFQYLDGVDTLVLSALRHDPSPVHFNIEEAIKFARRVNAKKTFFTHIAHELEHKATNEALPDDIQLAYDGLKIDFEVR